MNLLPVNLGSLANICAGAEHSRFGATTGVQLEVTDTGYTATATDGRLVCSLSG